MRRETTLASQCGFRDGSKTGSLELVLFLSLLFHKNLKRECPEFTFFEMQQFNMSKAKSK